MPDFARQEAVLVLVDLAFGHIETETDIPAGSLCAVRVCSGGEGKPMLA